MSDKNEIEIFVDTVNENKLNGYGEIRGDTIKRGDHFFYSQNKYQEEGRKLVYGVCSSATKGRLTVNGYVPKGQEPEHDPWVIDINNKFKEYRFYFKPNVPKVPNPSVRKVTIGKPSVKKVKEVISFTPVEIVDDEEEEEELPDHLMTPKVVVKEPRAKSVKRGGTKQVKD